MKPKPLGGQWITKTTVLAFAMVAIMGVLLLVRFLLGLGSVTNLNDGAPWGLWLAYDVVAGTAIGCGGYALALVVYGLNHGHYHPLMRPAILASLFGYGLGGSSVLIDLSRWWNCWHIFWPAYFNFSSVMIEVALCIASYTTILLLEVAPAVVERVVMWTELRGGKLHRLATNLEAILDKFLFVFIALGMTLPTMHQSSLGTMLIPFGSLIHPLWQTPILPALYLLTALSSGYAIVIFEATLVSDRFQRPSEAHILGSLSRYMIAVVSLFQAIRWIDLIRRQQVHLLFTSGKFGVLFFIETVLYMVPILLMVPPSNKENRQFQFISAVCLLTGGILYRVDSYLVAYNRPGWNYFPSVPELLITFGMIAVEILGYVLAINFLPILHPVEVKDVDAVAMAEA